MSAVVVNVAGRVADTLPKRFLVRTRVRLQLEWRSMQFWRQPPFSVKREFIRSGQVRGSHSLAEPVENDRARIDKREVPTVRQDLVGGSSYQQRNQVAVVRKNLRLPTSPWSIAVDRPFAGSASRTTTRAHGLPQDSSRRLVRQFRPSNPRRRTTPDAVCVYD